MKKIFLLLSLLFTSSKLLFAETVNIYGPGGPAPVMKALAKQFESQTNHKINLVAGPAGKWLDMANSNADIIFSGSEFMMNTFAKKIKSLDKNSIKILNLREAGILVRPGNPNKIKSLKDLIKKNLNVMVVDGAGQISLWEDIAAKNGDYKRVANLRKNITFFAKNSGIAVQEWKKNKSIDAWIIWKHWQVKLKSIADYVSLKKDTIYRTSDIALTSKGIKNIAAKKFYDFVSSSKAQDTWIENGWYIRK